MGGCKPKRGEHQEEVVLGNTKLDMLSRRMRCPFLRRRAFRLLEHVRKLLSAEEATLVDEADQICGLGNIRRGRHDPVGKRLSRLGAVQQDTADSSTGW